jgi:BirA family biotin operon repressor/biotin-[acetyl-CoA-carboxylase] ligase
VAGILAETKDQVILIGMGINCLQKSFPKELRNTATSIRKVSGKKFEVQDLISPLLTHLHRWLFAASSVVSTAMSAAESSGFSLTPSWKTELENRLYRRNESVWFLPGIPGQEEPLAGTILGITEEGLLLIKPEGSAEIREFAAGEILFRTKK